MLISNKKKGVVSVKSFISVVALKMLDVGIAIYSQYINIGIEKQQKEPVWDVEKKRKLN